jgi:quercetin dioxygenase-like cupin family protein
MTRNHQPGQSEFKVMLPEDIDWKPFPAFPPGVRLAVLVGHPTEPGPYVVRVKVPVGTKLMPHKHPEDRIYTVMSGVFYIGLGETFDGDKMKEYPPGSVIVPLGEVRRIRHAGDGDRSARPRISRPARRSAPSGRLSRFRFGRAPGGRWFGNEMAWRTCGASREFQTRTSSNFSTTGSIMQKTAP